MAAFGLPVAQKDDADRALRAAIAMIRSLTEWNAEREQAHEPTIEIGIGLNTDSVGAGNIGSARRMASPSSATASTSPRGWRARASTTARAPSSRSRPRPA